MGVRDLTRSTVRWGQSSSPPRENDPRDLRGPRDLPSRKTKLRTDVEGRPRLPPSPLRLILSLFYPVWSGDEEGQGRESCVVLSPRSSLPTSPSKRPTQEVLRSLRWYQNLGDLTSELSAVVSHHQSASSRSETMWT